MKRSVALALTLLAMPLMAQKPPQTAAPELSSTQRLAISAIQQEIAQIQQQAAEINLEVVKDYPGYQLDIFKTWSLLPIPKPAAPPAPAKPEAPKK